MSVNNIDTFKSLGLSTVEPPKQKKQELGQAEFLKLMTTQLKHQNPLQPMENGEFLAQMAQFGTVSGIQQLQKSFGEFVNAVSSEQALQAASLVGREVLVPGDRGMLEAGGELQGVIDLPGSTPSLTLKITHPYTGNVIRTIDLGGHAPGDVRFAWDGLDESGKPTHPGVYRLQAEARINGANTMLETQVQSRVDSVTMAQGRRGLQVNLAGLGAVDFNKIKAIH